MLIFHAIKGIKSYQIQMYIFLAIPQSKKADKRIKNVRSVNRKEKRVGKMFGKREYIAHVNKKGEQMKRKGLNRNASFAFP